jgi:hypothetical protein
MRRKHRIECLPKIRRLRVVVRRRRDLVPLGSSPLLSIEIFRPCHVLFEFFVATDASDARRFVDRGCGISDNPFWTPNLLMPPKIPESTFWSDSQMDFRDDLNHRIWTESMALQAGIHSPQALRYVNAIGAQQAMLDPDPLAQPPITAQTVLPWVPDLVGSNWEDDNSLLLVGSAYAGFIREYNERAKGMRIKEYLDAVPKHWSDFQTEFIKQVIPDYRTYYRFIEAVAHELGENGTTAANIAVAELCRASFVRRVLNDTPEEWAENKGYVNSGKVVRYDDSSEPSENNSADVFSQYVENKIAAEWLWERLSSGNARRVLVLGRIAEHGVLRCFGFRPEVKDIRCSKCPWSRLRAPDDSTWARPRNRAEPELDIDYWLKSTDWWTVTARVGDREREWHVLPTRHPARRSVGAAQVVAVLRQM